jgi:hypothetical protein
MTTLAGVGVGVKLSKLSSGSGLKGVLTHASLRDAAAKGQTKARMEEKDEG